MKNLSRLILISFAALGLSNCFLFDKKPKLHIEYTLRAKQGDILRNMSGDSQDSLFNAAVMQANRLSDSGNIVFMSEFAKIYNSKNNEGKLAPVFSSLPKYASDIHSTDPNDIVLKYLNAELHKELDKIVSIIMKRIDFYGLPANPKVKTNYTNATIIVDVKEYDEADNTRLKKILTTQGKFEMWNTYENEELINNLIEADKALGALMISMPDNTDTNDPADTANIFGLSDSILTKSRALIKATKDSTKLNPIFKILYPRVDNQYGIYPGPGIGLALGKDTAKVNSYLSKNVVKNQFPRDVKFLWAAMPANSMNVYELYGIKTNPMWPDPIINGEDIMDAVSDFDKSKKTNVILRLTDYITAALSGLDKLTNPYIILIKLKHENSYKLEKMTDEAANSTMTVNSKSKSIKRSIAIVIDGKVFSAPQVQNKITGGTIQITGIGDIKEAKDLATMLKSGAMPCKLSLEKEEILPMDK